MRAPWPRRPPPLVVILAQQRSPAVASHEASPVFLTGEGGEPCRSSEPPPKPPAAWGRGSQPGLSGPRGTCWEEGLWEQPASPHGRSGGLCWLRSCRGAAASLRSSCGAALAKRASGSLASRRGPVSRLFCVEEAACCGCSVRPGHHPTEHSTDPFLRAEGRAGPWSRTLARLPFSSPPAPPAPQSRILGSRPVMFTPPTSPVWGLWLPLWPLCLRAL